jgi:hypothetical protein
MEGEGRTTTTITVSRAIKDRFLDFVGAPKRFKNADLAMTALLDNYENKDRGKLEETVDGVHSS